MRAEETSKVLEMLVRGFESFLAEQYEECWKLIERREARIKQLEEQLEPKCHADNCKECGDFRIEKYKQMDQKLRDMRTFISKRFEQFDQLREWNNAECKKYQDELPGELDKKLLDMKNYLVDSIDKWLETDEAKAMTKEERLEAVKDGRQLFGLKAKQ